MRFSFRSVVKHLLFGLAIASFASAAQAPLEVRVALVIGNAAYKNAPALVNPVNDARDMSTTLKKLGFKVVELVDADRTGMAQSISELQDNLRGKNAVAMLYYAGHGLQLDWRNYMVPVDAQLKKAEDVPNQAIDVEQVIRVFKGAGTRMNILVLDACRDNPFSSTSGSRGLAQLDAPPGTYLAFATAPGNVAEDGDEASRNGLFTQYLLKELQRPASIESVFKRVRLQVRQKSQGRQIPWDASSLEDEFAFNDGKTFTFTAEDFRLEMQAAKEYAERLKKEAEAAEAREKSLAQQREQERLRLAEIQKVQEERVRLKAEAESRDRERLLAMALEEERKKAHDAQKALERARLSEEQRVKDIELARARAEEEQRVKRMPVDQRFEMQKADWDKIKGSKNADDFYDFLKKYPTGYITEQATFALESLQKAKITEQPDKNGVVQRLGVPRYRVGDYFEIRNLDERGKVIRVDKILVTRVENGFVYVNNQSEPKNTVDGGVIRVESLRGQVTYDPPRLDVPGGEFSVGRRWSWRSWMTLPSGRKVQIQADLKVESFEEVTIPAGTFKAYKIQQMQRDEDGSVYNRLECWYDPGWGLPLRCTREFPTSPFGRSALKESFDLIVRRRNAD